MPVSLDRECHGAGDRGHASAYPEQVRKRRSRLGSVAIVLMVCGVAGVAVVVLPFRSGGSEEMQPPGPACWFEQDPGSGASWLGAERVVGGISPHRVCDPIGPLTTPTSGPDFDAAVSDPEPPPLSGQELDRALAANRTGPPWDPSAWPWVAAFASGVFAVMAFVVWGLASLFTRRSRDGTASASVGTPTGRST